MLGAGALVWALLAPSGAGTPSLTSLNYTLADTAGGASITITGTNLASATSCTVGGTSATITGNTATTLTFTMPAKTAGTHNVQVTTAGGSSNTLTIEAWSPAQITGIDAYLDSRKGVAVAGSTLTSWTEQTRSAAYAPVATAPTKVASVFGSQPSVRFTQTSALSATRRNLGSGISVFWVGKWTSTDTVSDAYTGNSPLTVVGDTTAGIENTAGASAGALDFAQFTTGGWVHTSQGSGLNDGNARLVGWTLDSAGNLKAYVGTTQQGTTTALAGTSGKIPNNGYNAIGGGYNGATAADGYAGDLGAVIVTSGVISGTDQTKLSAWSRCEFGTP